MKKEERCLEDGERTAVANDLCNKARNDKISDW